MEREIKFEIKIKHKETGATFKSVLTIEDLITSGRLYIPEIHELVYVRRFTGLKDKNGKEIYDRDILAFEIDRNFKKELINHFQIEWTDYGNDIICWTQFSPKNKIVVVGNIYDNPELLNA